MKIPAPSVKRRARIEIIPLIDIIFFLLATFVMTSLSMVKNQGVTVQLPQARSAQVRDAAEDWTTITVDASSVVYWNKERIGLEDLPSKFGELKSKTADPKILIQGDKAAVFGDAVEVLDEARSAGISKVSIQTRPRTVGEAGR